MHYIIVKNYYDNDPLINLIRQLAPILPRAIREELILIIVSRANTGRIVSPNTSSGKYGMFCVVQNTLGLEGNIEKFNFQYTTFKIVIMG